MTAQLSEAPVVADETATGGDSGAEIDNAAAAGHEQTEARQEEPDGTEFYADDQPEGEEGREGTEDADESGPGEEQPEPVDAPASWKDEEKAVFAQLPREHQEIIARREKERDTYLRGKAQEHQRAQAKIVAEAQQTLAEIHARKAQEFQQLAAQFQPQPPDERLLYTGNPADGLAYQQQQAAYQRSLAQLQELQHRAGAEMEQAQRVAQAQEQQAALADLQSLNEKFPDWFEEGSLNLKTEIISQLEPIGDALGYPKELMAQANSRDLAALHVAHEWKAKADKWDALQKSKMAAVRAARKAPPIARPGAARPGGAAAGEDPLKLLYPND